MAGTANLNWPKGYSISYIVTLNNKNGVEEEVRGGRLASKVLVVCRLVCLWEVVSDCRCITWWFDFFALSFTY